MVWLLEWKEGIGRHAKNMYIEYLCVNVSLNFRGITGRPCSFLRFPLTFLRPSAQQALPPACEWGHFVQPRVQRLRFLNVVAGVHTFSLVYNNKFHQLINYVRFGLTQTRDLTTGFFTDHKQMTTTGPCLVAMVNMEIMSNWRLICFWGLITWFDC